MKVILIALLFMLALTSCESSSGDVDKFLGAGNVIIVEAPLDLDLTIDSPSKDGMSAGYSTVLEGTCTVAGSVIEVSGSGTGFGVCGLDLKWKSTIDLSGAPLGTVTLRAKLTNGSQQSDTEIRTLIKTTTACDNEEDREKIFAAGTGTTIDPYIICTGNQLSNIRSSLTSSYEIASDIELFGTPFNPLGYFEGNLEGNSFAIIDLNINQTGRDQVGLFSRFTGANQLIQNLEFRNANVFGDQRVGVLVGQITNATSNIVIDNINVKATVTGTDNLGGLIGQASNYASLTVTNYTFQGSLSNIGNNVGGLTGYSRSINFSNSSLNTTINSQGSYAGGAIGYLTNFPGIATNISNIESSLEMGLTTDLGPRGYLGGLVGGCRNSDNMRISSFSNIISSADIKVSGAERVYHIGGTLGLCNGNTLLNINSTLDLDVSVTSDDSSYAGGVAAYFYFDETSPITMNNLVSETNIKGNINYLGGIAAYVERRDGHNSSLISSNLKASGSIDSNVPGDNSSYIAGIFGQLVLGNNSSRVSLSDLSWDGNIKGYGNYISGGIADFYLDLNTDEIVIDNVSISGDIDILYGATGARLEYHGGLAGRFYVMNQNDIKLSNIDIQSNITREVSGINDQYLGGIIGYLYGVDDNSLSISGTNTRTGNISGAGNYISNGFGYIYLNNNPRSVNISNIAVNGNTTHTEIAALRNYVGGVVGRFVSRAAPLSISDITYNGSIILTDFANNVGGVIGSLSTLDNASNNTVTNVRNIGSNITNCRVYCGGVFGNVAVGNTAPYSIVFTSLFNNSSITSNFTPGSSYVGGIIGSINDDVFYVENSINIGDVVAQGDRVGGIMGNGVNRNNSGAVYGNTNLGDISGRNYVAGLVGYSRVYIFGNMNKGDITGRDYAGGIVGYGLTFNSNVLSIYENYSTANVYFYSVNATTTRQGIIAGYRNNANIIDGSNYFLSSKSVYDLDLVDYGNPSGEGTPRTDAQFTSSDLPLLNFGTSDGEWRSIGGPSGITLPDGSNHMYPIPSSL